MKLTVVPKKVALVLLGVQGVLMLLFVLTGLWKCRLGTWDRYGLIRQFHFGCEANTPSYFSALLLLICAVLLFVIAAWKVRSLDTYRWHWAALSVVFGCMSLDECAEWHDMWSTLVPARVASGLLHYFPWLAVGAVVVVVFALAFVGFCSHLPQKHRKLFLVAGVVYICGALGGDIACAALKSAGLVGNLVRGAECLTEESLEMGGAILFIHALLAYMSAYVPTLTVQIENGLPEHNSQEPIIECQPIP